MEFQCIAEGQNSRGLTINVKKFQLTTASLLSNLLARFPLAATLLPVCDGQSQFDCFDLELQGIHEKINKLRIKILRKKPAIPFLDKKNARLRGLITANNG
jgi:hypothetical protein